MIKIIGLGPGASDALTLGTMKVLKNCDKVFLRTEKHPTVEFIKDEGIEFETYDYAYETYDNFDEVYENIAKDLLEKSFKYDEVVYGVPGHPLVAEKSVVNLINLCEANSVSYEIIPAVSFVDAIMERLKIDPVEGLKIIDAFDINNQVLDKRIGTIITQVYNQFIASEVKLRLQEFYNDDTEIFYVRAAGIEGLESIRKMQLYELDMQQDIDYLTSIYIPKDITNKKDFNDLVDIIEILRGEEGCPWDREQTHDSLKKALIEESYEVIDAIDKQDDDALIEELGDVLLQVIFHASIGKEEGFFDVSDVIQGICNKMISRHPHVFNNEIANTSEEVLVKWDDLKRKEKGFSTVTDEINAIAKSLPALLRAEKIQKKAQKVGFDWNKVEDAIEKVKEELNELKEVYNGENRERIVEEMGDLLFACVNVARFLKVDGELALNLACDKFSRRFAYMEKEALSRSNSLTNMTLAEMDDLWNEAKKAEKL